MKVDLYHCYLRLISEAYSDRDQLEMLFVLIWNMDKNATWELLPLMDCKPDQSRNGRLQKAKRCSVGFFIVRLHSVFRTPQMGYK